MAFYNKINNKYNFVISFTDNPKEEFGIFAKSYFNAALQLAENLLSKQNFPDYEPYPVVFLYRHSLELYLKNIIYKVAIIMAFKNIKGIDKKLHNNHDLKFLSKKATEILNRIFPNDKDIENISNEILEICTEMSVIDKDSYSYRYPIDKKGKHSTKRHQIINLEAFALSMNDLLEKLDTINFGLNFERQEIFDILDSLN
jgi:hypothetical protein